MTEWKKEREEEKEDRGEREEKSQALEPQSLVERRRLNVLHLRQRLVEHLEPFLPIKVSLGEEFKEGVALAYMYVLSSPFHPSLDTEAPLPKAYDFERRRKRLLTNGVR